ncbi:MAG: hypothetical protein AAF628_31910 [Planctomycetota bacterium]
MKPRDLIATAKIPGHTKELRCYHHDSDYALWLDQSELMSTRVHGSEEVLAELAFKRLGPINKPHVLVGGLGMGFTLARVLALCSDRGKVDVAELVPEVVTWNEELFGHCAGHPLRDERCHLIVGDVGEVVRAAQLVYHLILLDVDNGPEGMSRPGNDSLYGRAGLQSLRNALRPSGVLGIWSAADDPGFERRLRDAQFNVQKRRVRARRTKGPWRTIWTAKRP